VITKVETRRKGNALILDIRIAPAEDALLKKGFTGNLSCSVSLPQDVKKDLLGSKHTEVWPQLHSDGEPGHPAPRSPQS
jgi:hypothetical protein